MILFAFAPRTEYMIMFGTATMSPIAVVFMPMAIPFARRFAFWAGSAAVESGERLL